MPHRARRPRALRLEMSSSCAAKQPPKIWFEANRVGHWEIACAELCGLGHYRMKGFVTVDTPEDFQKWLVEQAAAPPAPEQKQASAPEARGGNL